MFRRLLYLGIWLVFTLYAFVFAPPGQPDTLDLIKDLSTGQWAEVNPWITSLFNGMGLWPMIYTALLLRDGQRQSFPAWPFAIASFFVGAFAILPYLALRASPTEPEVISAPLNFWESKGLGIFLSVGFLVLLGYGGLQGDWGGFVAQWGSDRFIHVMSLDFCMLSILVPALTLDDRSLRSSSSPFWLDFIPVVGILVYLSTRSAIQPAEIV